jgi:hypothetical protein
VSPRSLGLLALPLGPAAALWTQLALYVLVEPQKRAGTHLYTWLGTAVGALVATAGVALSWRASRRSTEAVDRFVAALGLALAALCWAVVVLGYGIPNLSYAAGD